jgi:hypothetical protein
MVLSIVLSPDNILFLRWYYLWIIYYLEMVLSLDSMLFEDGTFLDNMLFGDGTSLDNILFGDGTILDNMLFGDGPIPI